MPSQKHRENALSEANCVVLGYMTTKDCQTHLTVGVLLISAWAPWLNGQHLFVCVFVQSVHSGGICLPYIYIYITHVQLLRINPRGRCEAKIWELLCQLVVFLWFLSVLYIYIYGIILPYAVPIITHKQVCNWHTKQRPDALLNFWLLHHL